MVLKRDITFCNFWASRGKLRWVLQQMKEKGVNCVFFTDHSVNVITAKEMGKNSSTSYLRQRSQRVPGLFFSSVVFAILRPSTLFDQIPVHGVTVHIPFALHRLPIDKLSSSSFSMTTPIANLVRIATATDRLPFVCSN